MDVVTIWETVTSTNIVIALNSSRLDVRREKMAVMFWIHGGSFATGTARAYDGQFLAQKNVVVITVNFRLQIFGYFDADGDGVMENLAMWDLRQALIWVRDNIEAFGGDKNRVTVFGGSSGGGGYGCWAVASAMAPIVSLIMMPILASPSMPIPVTMPISMPMPMSMPVSMPMPMPIH